MPDNHDELNAFKQSIADKAKDAHSALTDLNQASPTFQADKQFILSQLEQFQAYAPADAPKQEVPQIEAAKKEQEKAGKAPEPSAPVSPVKESKTLDAHPEIVKPADEKADDRPENKDNTPAEQKGAKAVAAAKSEKH